jgi:hypothetical protein
LSFRCAPLAIAERMKYAAVMAFILLWMFVVYFPLAHMVWGIDGFMNGVWNAKASIKGPRPRPRPRARERHRRAPLPVFILRRAVSHRRARGGRSAFNRNRLVSRFSV